MTIAPANTIAAILADPIRARWHHLDLLLPRAHPPHIRRHRAEVIGRRVQNIAAIFALLTPLWIAIDLAVFPWPLWGVLAALRLASAGGFALLAFPRRTVNSLRLALLMLAAMLAIPPAFYWFAHPFFAHAELDTTARLFAAGYSLLPFIVVAGMSVFPLTVVEVLAGAIPVTALTIFANLGSLDLEGMVRTLWLLALVAGIAVFSGVSQLHYMIALVNQAAHDVLTGAFTRRSGEEAIAQHFRIAARMGTSVAVGFVDLDNFKSINDGFGHEAGDAALRSAAQSLRGLLRRSDLLIRWGGEEFLVVLPNTDERGLATITDRLRQNGLGMRPDGSPLTASIGLAERIADNITDWDAMVRIADERMYMAKQSGKNRTIGCGNRLVA